MKRKIHYVATGKIKKPVPKYCSGYGISKGKCKAQLKIGQEFCTKCNSQRITDALAGLLNSPEGKQRLASALTNPIRQQLDYQSVVRRAVFVEPIPEGALPDYSDRVLVPEFGLTSSPTIKFSEIRERRFDDTKPKKNFKNRKFKTIAKC